MDLKFFHQKHVLKGKHVSLFSLPHPEAHLDAQFMLNDQKTMQYLQFMSPGDWTPESIKMRYERFYEDTLKGECLTFFAYDNESERLVSDIGFTQIDFDKQTARLAAIFDSEYSTSVALFESVYLTCCFGFDQLGLECMKTMTYEEDVSTHLLAKKLSVPLEFIEKESFYFSGQFKDTYVYALKKENWLYSKARLEEILEEMRRAQYYQAA